MSGAVPRRILIIRPSALGDVCRTVPVLVSLRRYAPEARIDWVVQDEFADAVVAHPDLTSVVAFPRRAFGGVRGLRWLHALRAGRYELVVDCQGLLRSALMAWATGARRRVGDRRARELGWLLYTARHDAGEPSQRHAVDRMLDLLAAEGIEPVHDMRLYVREEDRAWWSERAGAEEFAVLAPTARWASKRWPAERWRELLGPLRERGLRRLVVIGSPSERDQVEEIVRDGEPGMVDLVGRTTVGQTMAVVAQASLVVANDSAPLHMAVGLDRPLVGLFGPTDPRVVGPYGRLDAVVGGPAPGERTTHYRSRGLDDAYMRRIGLDEVVGRIDAALGRHAPAPAPSP